jgi:hypothetical protein
MDANAKLGPEFIAEDPYNQLANGNFLAGLVSRHSLCVVNGLTEKRKGSITRQKNTVLGVQKSIIDFVIASSDLIEHIIEIHIDEERVNVLTKNLKTKTGIEYIESDHNVINTKLKLSWSPDECKVIEVFKYADKEAQERFRKETTETNHLSSIINMKKPIDIVTNEFLKRLKGFIHKCFKKVKIIDQPNKELEELYNKRRILRNRHDEASKIELDEVDLELSSKYSDSMYTKILSEVQGLEDAEDGGFNAGKLWKLKKKLSPKTNEPPSAMENSHGKLITNKEDILEEAVNHYKTVFKQRVIAPGLEQLQSDREKLCEERLKLAAQNKSQPWSIMDVTNVVKSLKQGKAKDPYDMPNEIFKPGVAGDDLILAVTNLMNRIKYELTFPSPMNKCNVTNLYKKKGSKQSYNSYRGIFRTPVLRNILDKLMYSDEYENIDKNLTHCNVGSRKRRNIRDNLFVINAISNSCKQNPNEPTDLNVYDVFKCFDSLWLSECINDLYDTGLTNDKLVLIHNSNLIANIAIKTSSGTTDRFDIRKIAMQGTVWAGLMCTVSMDKLCKLILQDEQVLYKYRGKVSVPPLEMVDDIISPVNCGSTASALNATVNAFIETKRLKLSAAKCAKIHLGNRMSKNLCPKQNIHKEDMKNSQKEKYLGDFITDKGNSKETIIERKTRGDAILSEMGAILRDIPLGNKRIQTGLILRQAWFINSCFFNSEVWCGFNDKDLSDLEVIDHKILKLATGGQAKIPTEMLYLECAQIPIKNVLSVKKIVIIA